MFRKLKNILDGEWATQPIFNSPICVLMGNTGAGKTTLCNKLCGTNHKSQSQRGSCTTELFQNPVSCGSNPMVIIDTPGVDSQVDTYKHAILLKEALTGTPINSIFCVIKYDNRFDRTLQDYSKLLLPVEKYSRKIVVMISHMDLSRNREIDEEEIRKVFNDEYNFSNLIFYSDNDEPSVIADRMHSYASKMRNESLEISDTEFNLNFNLYQMRAKINVQYHVFLVKTKQIQEDYTNLIKDAKSNELNVDEKDEFLHMCIVSFKNELESLTDEFIQKHGSDMQELDGYGFLIMMQKEKIKLCNEFTKHVSIMMSYSLLDSSDPRNLIKRCPHCKEIWFKVVGCDGETTCGNRPTDKRFDALITPWWRFTFTRIDRKIQWEKLKMDVISETASPSIHLKQARAQSGQAMGCGKPFLWKDQPALEEEKIKELFQVKTIEEVKETIRKTDYAQMRQQYANHIDKKRYT